MRAFFNTTIGNLTDTCLYKRTASVTCGIWSALVSLYKVEQEYQKYYITDPYKKYLEHPVQLYSPALVSGVITTVAIHSILRLLFIPVSQLVPNYGDVEPYLKCLNWSVSGFLGILLSIPGARNSYTFDQDVNNERYVLDQLRTNKDLVEIYSKALGEANTKLIAQLARPKKELLEQKQDVINIEDGPSVETSETEQMILNELKKIRVNLDNQIGNAPVTQEALNTLVERKKKTESRIRILNIATGLTTAFSTIGSGVKDFTQAFECEQEGFDFSYNTISLLATCIIALFVLKAAYCRPKEETVEIKKLYDEINTAAKGLKYARDTLDRQVVQFKGLMAMSKTHDETIEGALTILKELHNSITQYLEGFILVDKFNIEMKSISHKSKSNNYEDKSESLSLLFTERAPLIGTTNNNSRHYGSSSPV